VIAPAAGTAQHTRTHVNHGLNGEHHAGLHHTGRFVLCSHTWTVEVSDVT